MDCIAEQALTSIIRLTSTVKYPLHRSIHHSVALGSSYARVTFLNPVAVLSDCPANSDPSTVLRFSAFGNQRSAMTAGQNENAVALNDLTFSYPYCPPFISNCSIDLPKGSRCLLIGANGAGGCTIAQ